jgi:hypothetical protein
MPVINVTLDGDGCWPDLRDRMDTPSVIVLDDSRPIEMAFLAGGMKSGRPSVTIRFDLPDGRTVLAQTSYEVLDMAVAAFRGKIRRDTEGG